MCQSQININLARIKYICQLFELQKKKLFLWKTRFQKPQYQFFSQGEIKQRKVNLNFVLELWFAIKKISTEKYCSFLKKWYCESWELSCLVFIMNQCFVDSHIFDHESCFHKYYLDIYAGIFLLFCQVALEKSRKEAKSFL